MPPEGGLAAMIRGPGDGRIEGGDHDSGGMDSSTSPRISSRMSAEDKFSHGWPLSASSDVYTR